MKLAIGMPVFERAWCLPLWFDSLEAQKLAPKEDITLCFVYSKSFDGTYDILRRRGEEYGDLLIYEYDIKTYSSREDMARFNELVLYRNWLLDMVKEVDPDYFLSWDNDILFYPGRLQALLEVAASDRVVGALMDMGGRDEVMAHPSVMDFGATPYEVAFRKPWKEYPHQEPFKCDIVMAVKLMGREVYQNARYRWDQVGEDIGFCHSCDELGYERWLQPQAHGIHLYDKDSCIAKMRRHRMDYPSVLQALSKWFTND